MSESFSTRIPREFLKQCLAKFQKKTHGKVPKRIVGKNPGEFFLRKDLIEKVKFPKEHFL